MLRSMTGFGSADRSVATPAGNFELELTLRSVNHRHLQVKARLGQEFAALEGEVEKSVRASIGRGSIAVHLNIERAPGSEAVRVNRDLARHYLEELRSLASELDLEPQLDLETLAGLPGVVAAKEDSSAAGEELSRAILETLAEALEALVAMRSEEGRALLADLQLNLSALGDIAGHIAERMPEVVREHKAALERRIAELIGDGTIPPGDLAREVAILSDRLDVSEEITRLGSHFVQFEKLLRSGSEGGAEPVGRKLDFLCQELFRELNTIGSKCNDATVAHLVVDAKTHAERLREQVQNVE